MCLVRVLIGSLNPLPFRDWPIRESVIPLKWKKLQLPFLLSTWCAMSFHYFHSHTSTWKSSSSTVLFNYFSICDWSWDFRHRRFKKLFILIRTLCSLTCKGSFPSHPEGQLSAAAILLPCCCPFIHSFILVSATVSRLRPSCQENISKRDILKRQMYKLLHFILCPSELSHRFFFLNQFYSKYLVSVLLI